MRSKILIISAIAVMFLIFEFQTGFACDYGDCGCNCEYRSPGYWKNHPDAWPVEQIMIGPCFYDRDEAIELMKMPDKGNKWFTMFRALVSAKLNIEAGCYYSSNVEWCVITANTWFYLIDGEDEVPANSIWWQGGQIGLCPIISGEKLYRCLDAFNNGRLCED